MIIALVIHEVNQFLAYIINFDPIDLLKLAFDKEV